MSARSAEYGSIPQYRSRFTDLSSFDVLRRLSSSVRLHEWEPSQTASSSAEAFTAEVQLNAGLHGFMMLSVVDDGYVLQRLDPGLMSEPSFRFILSSPPIAQCIQKIDREVGLHIPLRMVIQEVLVRPRRFSGISKNPFSTVIKYTLPSSLIIPRRRLNSMHETVNDGLLHKARNLDKMFEGLVEFIVHLTISREAFCERQTLFRHRSSIRQTLGVCGQPRLRHGNGTTIYQVRQ